MVGEKNSPRLETANAFRHGLFNCFFDEEPPIRASALRTLAHVVDYWTVAWQDYLRASWTPASPRLNRPPIARQSSNGSGVSPAPPHSRTLLRRDSSFKMHFEDVFGLDADDCTSAFIMPRMLDTTPNSFLPLTPEKEDGWASISGLEYAISPTETGSFVDGAVRFSNRGLGEFEGSTNRDVAWAGRQVSEEIWGLEEMRINLDNFYTWLLRFSIDCPFKDVRKGCREILKRAEKTGAQIPEVPVRGPSFFIPLGETIGLNYGPWTPATPNPRSPNPFDLSEDEEEGIMFSPRESNGNGSLVSGIMIPDPNKMNGDRTRSTSRGRTPVGSFGRGSRRTTVSMVSSLFQTPPSPPNGLNTSYKFKRRNHPRRQIPKFLPKPKPPSDEVRALQVNAYMRTGRIGNFNKILFHFPRFADVNREATDLFVSDDSPNGPLPQNWRIYLGILAAAEKKCQYYLSILSEKFLTVRGEREWLKGIDYAPLKLQRIAKLNMLLAHRPWTITPDAIKELVRGDENGELEPEQKWSMAEVVQAIIVMSFYHGKSATALAWGVLPEADLLGGTVKALEKCTPVAPFGSFAQSLSTDPPSEGSGNVGREESLKSTLGNLSRKRQQVTVGQDIQELPEKWRKTPNGSIPFISSSSSPASPILAPSKPVNVPSPLLRKAGTTIANESERHHHRSKSQKRRKSFEECATSEDAPPPAVGLNGFSLSAPNSYVPLSSLASSRALPARDYLLSPSSSTSSLFDTNLLGEQVPVNVLIEDCARFLHPESVDREHEDFDPNSQEYEFLPMEEFEWERNASSIISDYLDGVVDVLDPYFKEAQEADGEEEDFFASVVEMLPPRRLLTDDISTSGTRGEYTPNRTDSSEFEDLIAAASERHDRTGRSFNSSGRSASSPPRYIFERKSFKEAAWFYSLRLLGIQKDDFRYSEIKVLLDKGSRRYLKRVCAQPDMVSVADWIGAGQGMGGLRSEEKCLLALLACQARFMGEVLWGIRAVSEYIG